MSQLALLPRLLGNLLYEAPDSERNRIILNECEHIPNLFNWQPSTQIESLVAQLCQARIQLDNYAFSVLFEGQGKMTAPPWGSVYQTLDNTVMGDSTAAFHQFLQQIGLAIDDHQQPCDQIGIMFWAIAFLIEEQREEWLIQLLERHLLPWAYRYFALLADNDNSEFYAILAQICTQWLQQLAAELNVVPDSIRLYR